MSPIPPPLNASQAVERIREIIVGRHLERLEQRVARLETTATPSPAIGFPPDRSAVNESPLEALQQNVQRLVDSNRQQTELQFSIYREETQRLAVQIQHVAAIKAQEAPPRAVHQLEQKIGTWLTEWQHSFRDHLMDWDRRLANQIRDEVAARWQQTESHLIRLESRAAYRAAIEERFNCIALAARALAECAAPSISNPNPGTAP